MDDQRKDEGIGQPIWPPDPLEQAQLGQPATPALPAYPRFPTPTPPFPDFTPTFSVSDLISEAETARIPAPSVPLAPIATPASIPLSEFETARFPAPPRPTPALVSQVEVSDAPTERVPAAPLAPDPADAPTARLTNLPASAPSSPTATGAPKLRTAPPVIDMPARPAPPLPKPPQPAEAGVGRRTLPPWLAWSLAHWAIIAAGLVVVLLVGLAWGTYSYAVSLAAQPNKLVARYCAALTSDNSKGAYDLLTPALQQQTPEAQYLADASARDTISGKLTACKATPAEHLNALSFLSNPRALLFTLTETRGGVSEKGQMALTRDASGWHVAGYSANLTGIDLGPLHTEQALCQAFLSQNYSAAYALLSAPYQTEQGSETAFSQAFGKNLRITGCEPTLKDYTVDKADQRASIHITLDVAATSGGSSTKFTIPADVTLAREAAGWRVDTITPTTGA